MFKATFIFENEKAYREWLGWYVDGGGEQDSNYFVDARYYMEWLSTIPTVILDKIEEQE